MFRFQHKNKDGIDYNDPFSVQSQIGDSWWLMHPSCKYLLCCLVCKDCKDINTKPCEHPPGNTRVAAREAKRKAIGDERWVAKSERAIEKYGDINQHLKKVRLSGMQEQTEKIKVDTINVQIKIFKENKEVYKSVNGLEAYNELLVSLITKMTGKMSNGGTMPSSALTIGKQISLLDDNIKDE
jgi:hypothetical protein